MILLRFSKEVLRKILGDNLKHLFDDDTYYDLSSFSKNIYLFVPFLYIQEKKNFLNNFMGIMVKYFGYFYVHFLW